jgi:hypothetical protein
LTTSKGVLHNYPISSVESVAPPAPLFSLSEQKRFFFQRFTCGTVETSLYSLEHSVIRKRFADPRCHYALNCASSSCPQLPRVPFYPDRLDEQLEFESKKFINLMMQDFVQLNYLTHNLISWVDHPTFSDPCKNPFSRHDAIASRSFYCAAIVMALLTNLSYFQDDRRANTQPAANGQ